ncbi:hypothetical protein QVD17_37829 [Tagetes erecta]|uniref:FBD domain-containing protein n=1 Tax=Tagetes erecta TaxID=13708 RepID=A0AAD8JZ23_TARER|nr:hypothetical protein QVD17_37829 [Tagetes erecta]
MLSLSLYSLESRLTRSANTVFELVGFLPKLQNLHLDFYCCQLTEVGAKKTSRVVFPFIRTLKLSKLDLGNSIELSCALKMIRRFSSLQNLEITSTKRNASPFPQVEYNTIRLRSVVITSFKGLENEVGFIKYILACSPFLEKIAIYPEYSLTTSDRLTLTMKLLKLHRASLIAEIDFTNVSRYDIDQD